ncbi:MAG: DUF664 domain-containing protein, partial [Pseudonocardiaceae bacterium]
MSNPSSRSSGDGEIEFPVGNPDERELLLNWLNYLRRAVLRKIDDVADEDARWRPQGRLLPLLGVINHLTRVEWRWIDGGIRGHEINRSEEEFFPGPDLTVQAAVTAYRDRAAATNAVVRSTSLDTACHLQAGTTLRWVLL